MTRRYLVTGGCGFIGRHLCAALVAEGHRVTVLDNLSSGEARALPPGARLVRGDIRRPQDLAEAMSGCDGVFHLAAVSSIVACAEDRPATRSVNVDGTAAVLDASAARPLVFVSSAAVYGEQTIMPIPESALLRPISPYAEDKLAAEALVRSAAQTGGTMILRPFNVFGPGQVTGSPYSGVITRFAEAARAGQALTVNGDGGQTRDFIHVADVAWAMVLAMRQAETAIGIDVVNLCRGETVTVLELALLIGQLAGSTAPVRSGPPRSGDIRDSRGDPARARALLGFEAQITLAQGLADLLHTDGAAVA